MNIQKKLSILLCITFAGSAFSAGPLGAVIAPPNISLADATTGNKTATVSVVVPTQGDIVNIVKNNIAGGNITTGGLGQRIGRFQSAGNGSRVRAPMCMLSGTFTDDNAALTRVIRVGGPYTDGTSYWQFDANNHFPTRQWMSCYFNGPAGDFETSAYNNWDNTTAGGYWDVSGTPEMRLVPVWVPPSEGWFCGDYGCGNVSYPGGYQYQLVQQAWMRYVSYAQQLNPVAGDIVTLSSSVGAWQTYDCEVAGKGLGCGNG